MDTTPAAGSILGLSALIGLAAAGTSQPGAQAQAEPRQTPVWSSGWIDAQFAELMDRYEVAGAACAIVRSDEVALLRGYGLANRETGEAVDPEQTLFYLASVTKAFTATTAAIMAEDGLVDMDADVARWLDGVVEIAQRPGGPVTLRHLLTHTGGFDDRNIGMAAPWSADPPGLGAYLAEKMPPRVRPAGVIASYNNHEFALAGLVLEQAASTDFASCIENRLLEPAGMSRTTARLPQPPELIDDVARGYVTRRHDGETVWLAEPRLQRNTAPAGAVSATPADMARFMRLHLGGGEIDGARVWGATAQEILNTRAWSPHPQADGLTVGFWERTLKGHRCLIIQGNAPEGSSLVLLAPGLDLGLFITANRQDAVFMTAALTRLLGRLLPEAREGAADETSRSSTPATLGGFAPASVTGEYFIERYSQRTLECLAKWEGTLRVEAVGPRTIRVEDSRGGKRDYVASAPGLYERPDAPGYIAFQTDGDGRVRWATTIDGFGYGDGLGFPQAFRRAAWHERVVVKRGALAVGSLALASAVVLWPAGLGAAAMWKRLRRKKRRQPPPQATRLVPMAAAALGLAGVVGVAATLASRDSLLVGLPWWSRASLGACTAFAILAPFMILLAGAAWRRRWLGLMELIYLSTLAAAMTGFAAFLWSWNLVTLAP